MPKAFAACHALTLDAVKLGLASAMLGMLLLVFALRGIRPRTWLERRSAKRSTQINLAVWGGLLLAITALIVIVLA